MNYINKGEIKWIVPKQNGNEKWKICLLHITRNYGPHPDYINMMDQASCRILIDSVYEPHYARYKDDFGKTIAGFFSDEPELGNGHLYGQGNLLGSDQDLPWSKELEVELEKRLGDSWVSKLPLLWDNNANSAELAKVRYAYMDAVTNLVAKNFSFQLGDWCRERNVEYIGHVIEDNNQHARTGSSLGHYFRGLAGQDMGGIDDIGEQVLPQGEDLEIKTLFGSRDGEFYHYVLGKLASSHAAIDPLKKGRAMCEIFGNYSWAEGVRLEKYLADHFLVRGINRFVPHAFSPKAFPDPDCPPHFYAHGHNPQYRHFGELMKYMNRICELLSDGFHIAPIAILYHGEAEWTGKCMLMQKPARILADRQIDFDIIPQDVFFEDNTYKTQIGKTLHVNTQEYKILVVPYAQYITKEFANAIVRLTNQGFPIVFIDDYPEGICNGTANDDLLQAVKKCNCIELDSLISHVDEIGIAEVTISPANNRIRYIHYKNDTDVYMFVNESTEKYEGSVTVSTNGGCFFYNAWDNHLEKCNYSNLANGTKIELVIEPLHSCIVVFGDIDEGELKTPLKLSGSRQDLCVGWERSICEGIEYPNFTKSKAVTLPDKLAEEESSFSGFVKYTVNVEIATSKKTFIEITDAYEGVELFVNGKNVGIQIVPPFRYDITEYVISGNNQISIEVATTLERQIGDVSLAARMGMAEEKEKEPTGVTGYVYLYQVK